MVMFDSDGVLEDSEGMTHDLLRDDLAAHGLDMPWEDVSDLFIGGTMAGVCREATRLGAALPEGWVDDFYRRMDAMLAEKVEAITGAEGVLERLVAAGIPFAVGSNGRMRKMEITLGKTGLMRFLVGRYYSAQEMGAPKPAPDVYLHAAKAEGIAPSDCVVIEDSATGARAAVAAGIPCYGFIEETAAEQLAPHCAVLFDDMAKLPALLGIV
jgi:HAD superfamily hydrolase (TIGR01509 family)